MKHLTPAYLFRGLTHRGQNPAQIPLIDTPERRATPAEVDAILGPLLDALKNPTGENRYVLTRR